MNRALKRIILAPFSLLYKVAPVAEQKLMFRLKCGYKLNLKDPRSFNEKLAWIKLYDRDPRMPSLADKYLVRQYIREQGYGDHLPQLYWQGFDAREIPFDTLPRSFVLKVTSGSGGNILVKNKDELDKKAAIKQLNKWLKEKYLPAYGEWHYCVEKPRIIVEEYLDNGVDQVPPDYKMMYFNGYNGGDVAFTWVDTGRFVHHRRMLYDSNWDRMIGKRFAIESDLENIVPRPACYDEMAACTRKLAAPFAHVRVDFYVIGERFYIGEITFFNGAGYDMPTPMEFSRRLGDMIKLKKLK